MLLKIGELARRTGLTVRTLHHYDSIKLLCPSGRSPAGYRLYDRNDVARLHRIQALRKLDIPLAEIAALLEGQGADLQTLVAQQIAALDQQIVSATELRARLAGLQEHLRADREPELDDWLSTLALMNFYDRYFTLEEREQLRHGGRIDEGDLHEVKEALRRLMQSGEPPASDRVLPLAARWIALSSRYLAQDARLIRKMDFMHRSDPDVHVVTGIDPVLLDYLTQATAEYRLSLYARHVGTADIDAVRPRFHRHYLEWPALFAEARELQARGVDALAPEALDLAARWIALFRAVWGEDESLHRVVVRANETEPDLMGGMGIDDASMRLIRTSLEHLKSRNNKP